MAAWIRRTAPLSLLLALCAGAEETPMFRVRPGELPWHDRVGMWRLGAVPEVLQSDAPVPAQTCGSRQLAIPPGAKAVVFAVGKGDADRIRKARLPIRETDLTIGIDAADGSHTLVYEVLVYRNPPADLTFEGLCSAGLVLLRTDDDGIESTAFVPPEEMVPPPKTAAQRAPFHLYLLIGQSNMAGRGRIEPQDVAMHPRVLTLDKDNRWVAATDPIHFDKAAAGVGLGTTFGRIVADRTPGATIGLIPCAVGGTRVSQWQKDAQPVPPWGHLYGNAVERTRIALRDGVLHGILWHQGEGDSSEGATTAYLSRLTRMLDDLRADLEIGPEVPFVAGQVGVWDPEKHAGRQRFNENLLHLPEQVANSAVVTSEDLTHIGDGTHFSAEALRELGRRYADAMATLTPPAATP